jgi:hypothetical protein
MRHHKKVVAHMSCVCPNYNWAKSFQFRVYNPVGWTIYEYQSNWQWAGGCDNVVYAHHEEPSARVVALVSVLLVVLAAAALCSALYLLRRARI